MKTILSLLLLSNLAVANEIIPISEAPDLNEYMGSSYQLEDDRICVAFTNIPDFSKLNASLYLTCQDQSGKFLESKGLFSEQSENFTYIQNPRVIYFQGKTFLYFNAYKEDSDIGFWGRAEIRDDEVGEIEWLAPPQSLDQQYRPWIYPYVLQTGELLVTYEIFDLASQQRELRFALSSDGIHFSPSTMFQTQAQMTRFFEFANGSWAFVYQVGNGNQMMDYVKISNDRGQTFSDPIAVSSQSNVHDPTLLLRKDGLLDVYYGVGKNSGYVVNRRKINLDGTLGAEETISDNRLDLQKSNPVRLRDGGIFVSVGKVNHMSDLNPTSDLIAIKLEKDAE